MLPAPGGDVVRDGAGVLPTGRNIHALDPYRIPSAAAMVRGRTAATLILEAHRKKGRSHLRYALSIISSLHILLSNSIPIMLLLSSSSCQVYFPPVTFFLSLSFTDTNLQSNLHHHHHHLIHLSLCSAGAVLDSRAAMVPTDSMFDTQKGEKTSCPLSLFFLPSFMPCHDYYYHLSLFPLL
jgi:CobN/Magnesium Chelatase